MLIKQKIKAFTMIELLITMTLTAILVVFAFMGYNQIQKLFINYTVQNNFITDYNQLNKALFILSNKSKTIEKTSEHLLKFKNDSNTVELELTQNNILLKFKSHTDTFDLIPQTPKFDFVKTTSDTALYLITNFQCTTSFQNQKLSISFQKEYDASSILKSTLQLLPPDEQY
ncbi:MAG: hypothetical protein C0448_14555 [Sphingobacteriaceae bacterium]|nr:hypothetical protein [Sphingobacteriaceae bacterium]